MVLVIVILGIDFDCGVRIGMREDAKIVEVVVDTDDEVVGTNGVEVGIVVVDDVKSSI